MSFSNFDFISGIFYSITSTQTGLRGIELGTFLIKQAVQRLKDEFPEMGQFSTLSPAPGFRSWLLTSLQAAKKSGVKIFTDAEFKEIEEYLGRSVKTGHFLVAGAGLEPMTF